MAKKTMAQVYAHGGPGGGVLPNFLEGLPQGAWGETHQAKTQLLGELPRRDDRDWEMGDFLGCIYRIDGAWRYRLRDDALARCREWDATRAIGRAAEQAALALPTDHPAVVVLEAVMIPAMESRHDEARELARRALGQFDRASRTSDGRLLLRRAVADLRALVWPGPKVVRS